MGFISLIRILILTFIVSGALVACASDEEGEEQAAIAPVEQVGQPSAATPAPQVAAQRPAQTPENANWDPPADSQALLAKEITEPLSETASPLPLSPGDAAAPPSASIAAKMTPPPIPATPALPTPASSLATEMRLRALEGQVADLRSEFNNTLPAIRALIAQKVSAPSATASAPAAMPAAKAPPAAVKAAPDSAPAKPPAEVAPAAGGSGIVSDLRIGVHPGKTRLVLDVSAPVEAGQDLDNSEKLLILDLPGMAWKAAEGKSFPAASILSSYSVQPASDGKGSTVAFQLRGPAKILSSTRLKPDSGKGHRLVIDLAAE